MIKHINKNWSINHSNNNIFRIIYKGDEIGKGHISPYVFKIINGVRTYSGYSFVATKNLPKIVDKYLHSVAFKFDYSLPI